MLNKKRLALLSCVFLVVFAPLSSSVAAISLSSYEATFEVSANAHKEDTLSATGSQFEALPIDKVIFTKLDETYIPTGVLLTSLFE